MKFGEELTEDKEGKKDLLVPKDSYQMEQIKKVIRRAALELRNYDIDIEENFKLYTVAVYYLQSAFVYLNTKYEKIGENDLNLGGLINIGLSVRTVRDAEKTGNINAVVTLGDVGNHIVNNIRDYVEPEQRSLPLMTPEEGEEEDVLNIQSLTVKQLIPLRMFFKPEEKVLYTSVMCFLKAAIIITVMEAVKNGSSIINIEEAISINGMIKDGKIQISCGPGAYGKQWVKSDGATEEE